MLIRKLCVSHIEISEENLLGNIMYVSVSGSITNLFCCQLPQNKNYAKHFMTQKVFYSVAKLTINVRLYCNHTNLSM